MSRTDMAVVSNRGPLSFSFGEDGQLVTRRAGGGLVATLFAGARASGALWIAGAISDADRVAAESGVVEAEGFHVRSMLVGDRYEGHYNVISNGTLWFVHHHLFDLPRQPRYDSRWWDAWTAYCEVNQAFAEVVAEEVATGGTVLVQDFHLALLGKLLRQLRPDLKTTYFHHAPFAGPQAFGVLPDVAAETILEGMAGFGACGFHSQRWASAYEACTTNRPPTFVSPAAADADDVVSVARSAECQEEVDSLDALVGDRQLLVRVDRIELSKNVLRGFHAYDEMLDRHPNLRGRVVFAASVYPSRQTMPEYLAYQQEVETLVEYVNARWKTNEWTPIVLDTSDHFPRSVSALRRYDVLLVNPLADGLNLVAKEGPLVNERDGVVVLSRNAGVWDELSDAAVGIQPFDIVDMADTMAAAFEMPAAERSQRAADLRKLASARTPIDWFDDLVKSAR
jgi:trehalose 6-phosphate synthase